MSERDRELEQWKDATAQAIRLGETLQARIAAGIALVRVYCTETDAAEIIAALEGRADAR